MNRYSVILADPPWRFSDRGSRISPDHKQRHYPTMTLADVKAAGVFVRQLAADDAFLFLWAPNALVCDGTAFSVVAAWGFVAKQLIPWIKLTRAGKPAIGMGHYTRVCSEQLILARRGRPKVAARNVPGVVRAPRGRHSAKPDASVRRSNGRLLIPGGRDFVENHLGRYRAVHGFSRHATAGCSVRSAASEPSSRWAEAF